MSSTSSAGKPFCWRLRCGSLCCCTVVRAESTARSHLEHSLLIPPQTGSGLTLPPLLLTAGHSGRDSQTWRERRESCTKAHAHRFAVFRYDFPPLLLHKKGRILDYLWHPKLELKACWGLGGLHSQCGLCSSRNSYQVYLKVSPNMSLMALT